MKTVTAAIIQKENTILLTRRAPGETLAGFWEFPGGKMEEGETPQYCLERELFEEFGVQSIATNIVAKSTYTYTHGEFELLAIQTKLVKNEITLKVHDCYEWVPINKILEYNLLPADISIAKTIQENMQ